MISIAIKMLIGNKAAFMGVVFGIFLAILLISQQSGIFLGLVARSYRMVTDISLPNIWVVDPATEGEDTIRTMPQHYLDIVKDTQGIAWAVPLNLLELPVVTSSGNYKVAQIYGIDDATLIGAPPLLKGNIQDLHRDGGVVIDSHSADEILASTLPNGTTVPIKIGDTLEINNRQAVVVGIGKITPGFYPQPIIFTTNSQFEKFSSSNRTGFIAAKTRDDANVKEVLNRLNSYGKFVGLTSDDFEWRIAEHFLKTGILINFGLSVALGLIIGLSITGQIFYIMTLDSIHYYALIKALGGTRTMILKMIIAQAAVVGTLGFALGTSVTLLWGLAIKETTLAFMFPWELLFFTGFIALVICLFSVSLSIQKVFRIEPKVLMNI